MTRGSRYSTLADADPSLAAIQRFPTNSLDPEQRACTTVVVAGALAGNRQWAIVDRPSEEPYDPDSVDVTVRVRT